MALPYAKQFTIRENTFGKLFEWSVEQFGGRPCGYARILCLDSDADLYFQVEKDGPLVKSLERATQNEVFVIDDPYVAVQIVPVVVPCRVTIYAVMEDLSRVEVNQIARERQWATIQGTQPNINREA